MNETKAYDLLKSALTPDEPTGRLDSAIKAHLSTAPPKPRVMPRTVWGIAAAAAVTIGAWVIPTLSAEASFGAICQALDDVHQRSSSSRLEPSTQPATTRTTPTSTIRTGTGCERGIPSGSLLSVRRRTALMTSPSAMSSTVSGDPCSVVLGLFDFRR